MVHHGVFADGDISKVSIRAGTTSLLRELFFSFYWRVVLVMSSIRAPFGVYLELRCCTFSRLVSSPSRRRRRDARGAPKVDDDVVLRSSIPAAAQPQPRRSPILPTALS